MTTLTPLVAQIPEDWLRRKAPELARDIVARIDVASNLATMYGLNPDQWETLRVNPWFKQLVSRAHEDLSGPAGTAEIARRKAALAIEQVGVMTMAQIMTDEKSTAGQKNDAFDSLARVAGLDKGATATATNPMGLGGPLINIIVRPGASIEVGALTPDKPAIEGQTA